MAKGKIREVLEGKVFSSKSYGDFEVLEYLGNSRYTIRFIQTGTKIVASKHFIKEGSVMDRFYPSIYNTGYVGTSYDSNNFLYSRWVKMIDRCYNIKSRVFKYYGAKGIIVCDRWHNFSNYVDDVMLLEGYDENLVKSGKLQLDKDIINREALIYSPETCKWVTNLENAKERFKRTVQKYFVATRLSDNYIEEHYSITEFCEKWKLNQNSSVTDCLNGRRNDYMGWKFEYKENPIKYIHQTMATNKSGYKGINWDYDRNKWYACGYIGRKSISLGRHIELKDAIIARYEWEVENQGVYRKPDSKDDYLKSIGYI